MNGHSNGHLNGHLNGIVNKSQANGNGHIKAPLAKLTKRTPSASRSPSNSFGVGAAVSIAARLLLWYSVITAIFRCPSLGSDLTDDSPSICKPYLQARHYITPHVEPYYHAYLEPYVEQAQPHLDRLNKTVYQPGKKYYDAYGAPRVAQAQVLSQAAWVNTVKPRLELRRQWVMSKYDGTLSPYVNQGLAITNPYVTRAKSEVSDIYESTLVPAYRKSLPLLQWAYVKTSYVATEIMLPYARIAEETTTSFLSRQVWPWFVILYGENVEPQLMKISERLGRYKDSRKLEASVKKEEVSTKAAKSVSSISSAASVAASSPSASVAAETEKEGDSRDKIEADLKTWQEKFAKAAEKGAENLEERVKEITRRQIDSQAHVVGEAFVARLVGTANSAIDNVKTEINGIVKALPEDANAKAEDAAYEQILSSIRSAGSSVKEKAQAVRTWKQRYDNDTLSLVEAALQSTYNVIDNIRDLGLQEIGRRWAWIEGVTYQDWTKYHDLKSTFDEWRNGVEKAALDHKGLTAAQEEGEQIQESGMAAAEKAAKELARLKEVAQWKIHDRDSTDNFSNAGTVKRVANKMASSVESVAGAVTEGLSDAPSSVSEAVLEAPSSLSEAVYGSQGTVESLSSQASNVLDSVVSAASTKTEAASSVILGTPPAASRASSQVSKVFGGAMAATIKEEPQIVLDDEFVDDTSYSERIQSMISAAGDKASDLTNAVSAAMIKPTETQGSVQSVASVASEQYEKAMSAASSALYGTTPGAVESISSAASSAVYGTTPGAVKSISGAASNRYEQAVTAASYAIYGTPAPVLSSLASQASSQYEEAKRLANEQYSKASVAVAGTPKAAHEQALSSIGSAYTDSLSAASVKFQSALSYTASITSLWATPTQGTYESISSLASVRLQEGLSQASAQYESAKIAVGAQPTPAHQKYLGEAQKQYYQGIGLAHDRYSQFLTAASGAVYGTPTPVHQSWLSAAQSQYSVASSVASVKYYEALGAASSVAGQTTKSPAQSVVDSASSQYSAALAAASGALFAASSSASLAVYGTPTGNVEYYASVASSSLIGTETPWTEAAASQASENWEALVSRASSQIYGAPTPWHESAWSQAGGYAAQATDAAAIQYSAVQSLINDLVVGKEPDFTESVMARFSSAYYTGIGEYAASASSVASDAYASASSVVSSVFTPPATLEVILDSASEQLNAAVEAASIGIYGSQTGSVEAATSAAASAYGSVQSRASEAIYGTQTGYAEAAQSSLADVASSAQSAISVAIYGTPTGTVEAATSGAASVYSSVSSVAADNVSAAGDAVKDSYNAAASRVSSAIYGPEKGAVESATNRLAVALESAKAKLSSMAGDATGAAAEQLDAVRSNVEAMASSIGSAASSASTTTVRDEL